MKLDKYRGITPTPYVCYGKAGEVSEDGVWALTRYLMDQEVKDVYAGGSSEECIYQSVEDRRKTLEAVMDEAAGYLTVIIHAACNNMRDSRTLAAHTRDLSVDGTTVIPPIYPKLPEYSAAGYQNGILEAAPKMNFIIYNIPRLAGTALTMNLLKTVLLNSQVAGVKNPSMSIQGVQMFKMEAMKTRQSLIVFDDPGEQLVFGLAMGVDGGISGTYGAMLGLFLEIYELVSENRIVEARAAQYEVDEVIYKLCSGARNMYAMIKEVLYTSRGIDIDGVRKPLVDLCGSDRAIAGEATAMIGDAKERYC